nr:prepilin peptidase [uncultured Sphingosinicella sp.]
MQGVSANLLVAILAAMLIIAATGDLRSRRIPNWLTLSIAVTAIPFWWMSGLSWADVATQIGIATGVFVFFAILFHVGMMGGGDVKLLAALGLWLPLGSVVKLLVIMAIAGGVLTLGFLARHRLAKHEGKPEIPYGVAIAFAGMWLIGERFLYQFG